MKIYKKQKNFCSKLYKKERKKIYSKIDKRKVTDNKTFWKTITPFISSKAPTRTDKIFEKNSSFHVK